MHPTDDETTGDHLDRGANRQVDSVIIPAESELAREPFKADLDSDQAPRMAPAETMLSSGLRIIIVVGVVVAILAYLAFGTVLARNVTFNRLLDQGALNGIRRYSRETILDVWRTMWDRAPDFGSIDLTRGILLVSTVAFFAAFVMIITLVFVPSRREWAAGLGDGQESDTIAGD